MRKIPVRFGLLAAGFTFLSLVVAVTIAIGAEDPTPQPVAGVKNIMNAVNHEEHGLYGMIKGFCDSGGSGASGDTWKIMRHRAQIIAECGNVLMDKQPPRGGDDAAGLAKWKQHCANFRGEAKALSKALAMRKIDRAKAALAKVAAQCEACHKDHRSN